MLAASRLNLSTGGTAPEPRVDVGLRTSQALEKGYRLALEPDHSIAGVMPEMLPAQNMAPDHPVPYYLAAGHKLKHRIEEGELLTYNMIDHDGQSILWQLRREQDAMFERCAGE